MPRKLQIRSSYSDKTGQSLFSIQQGKIDRKTFNEDLSTIIHNAQSISRKSNADICLKTNMSSQTLNNLKQNPSSVRLKKLMDVFAMLGIEIEIKGPDFKYDK